MRRRPIIALIAVAVLGATASLEPIAAAAGTNQPAFHRTPGRGVTP
ncbi:MAG TPA: hypothetical protein VG253_03060 [Streptosporangiaceae bacterium]|nr:hypothetical protein [Streptosporangiaceae bacterium]